QVLVVVRADAAAREGLFQVAEYLRVNGHHIFKMAVDRAILDHQNLSVALNDLSFDLSYPLVTQDVHGKLAVKDSLADLRDALRAQAVGGPRPAERRLGLLPGFEQGFVRPSWNE